MSGGSYNYLCYAESDTLLHNTETIKEMSDRLAGLGYASDAAAETEDLLLLIRQALNRIEARRKRLEGVWKAIEWWDSADWGEDQVKKALEEYRGELEAK